MYLNMPHETADKTIDHIADFLRCWPMTTILRNSIRTSAAKAEHYHPSFALPSLSEYVLNNELKFRLVVTSLTILISSAVDAVKRTCSLHCIGENPKFVLNVLV